MRAQSWRTALSSQYVTRLTQVGLIGAAVITLAWFCVPPRTFDKDFQQEFLMGKALLNGLDIYASPNLLSARFFPAPTVGFFHPSPYPPIIALLSAPFTVLPYPVLAALWLLVSIGFLLPIGHWLGLSTRGSLALAAWPPIWWVLAVGNLDVGLLVLTMLAWRDARAGREWRAGAWLGIAAALKLYPALFVAPYLYRRRFRVVAAAVLAFAVGQLGNLLIVGPAGLAHYYRDILPTVGAVYVGQGLNSSPYGALLRIFGGATNAAPLVAAPSLVAPLAIAIAAGALIALFVLEPEAAPVAALLILPTTWGYYAVFTLPLIVKLARTTGWTRSLFLAAAAASATWNILNLLVLLLPGDPRVIGSPASIFTDLFLVLQPAGYVGLIILGFGLRKRATTPFAQAIARDDQRIGR